MPDAELIVGLDVGSASVRALVAESSGEKVNPVALGIAPSAGVRRGIVTDLDLAAGSIAAAVADAEKRGRLTLGKVVLGITGEHLSSLRTRGVGATSSADQEVRRSDVQRVVGQAQQLILPPEREIVQVLVRQFHLDGQSGIKNPVGMSGLRLEAETHLVTALSSHLKNLLRAVEGAGLTVAEPVLASLASASAVLTAQERELGVLLLDIGANLTDWAVFSEGEVLASGVVPLGGERVTLDLALGLGIVRDDAERLKCLAESADPAIDEIVLARMAEILELVAADRARSGASSMLPGGTVLCGGGAKLRHLVELSQELFGGPARVGAAGRPAGRWGDDTALAGVYGLALWGARRSVRPRRRGFRGWLDNLLRPWGGES